jgi:serine/threonine-protein kinase
MRDSHVGRPMFTALSTFPVDESPYGVRHLAGNVRDWCLDEVADGRKVDRGGFWLGSARESRLADQHEHVIDHRASEIGFRLARSL